MEGYNQYITSPSPYADEEKNSKLDKKNEEEKTYVKSLNVSTDSDLNTQQIESFDQIEIKSDGFSYLNEKLLRIVTHWSVTDYNLSENAEDLNKIVKNKKSTSSAYFDYHCLVQYDTENKSCNIIKGYFTISDNYELNSLEDDAKVNTQITSKAFRANHCKSLQNSIGICSLSMKGASESAKTNGDSPMKEKQWNTMAKIAAKLCDKYNIKISPKTIMGHWEANAVNNIRQNGKWDPMRLPWVDKEDESEYYFKHGNQFRIEALKRKSSFNTLTIQLNSLLSFWLKRNNNSTWDAIFNHKFFYSYNDKLELENRLLKLEVKDISFLNDYMFEEDVINTKNVRNITNEVIKDYLCYIKAKYSDKISIIKVHSKNKLSDFEFNTSTKQTNIKNAKNDDRSKSLYSRLNFSDLYLKINITNCTSGIVKI